MNKRQIINIIFTIVLPPILVIALFVVAFGAFVIPVTEKALMQKKKDTVVAIVMASTSIMEKHVQSQKNGIISKEQAMESAIEEMRALRYGKDNMDYLWVTDLEPKMVMHPYFSELEGKRVNDYKDADGKLIFIEASKIANSKGDGYIEYKWAHSKYPEKIVPKISYIKKFEPWGWIVGSGIYVDDVKEEINVVTNRIIYISLSIGILIILITIFMVWRGIKTEKRKYLVEKELYRSHERYQALAHASGEILFIITDGIITGTNKKACEVLEIEEKIIVGRKFEDFFANSNSNKIFNKIEQGINHSEFEISLRAKNQEKRLIMKVELAKVNNIPSVILAGYEIKLNNNPEYSSFLEESLRKCDFGMFSIEDFSRGKIVWADKNALDIFSLNIDSNIIGMTMDEILYKEDISRIFILLRSEKKVSDIIVKLKNRKNEYLKIWASTIENSIDYKEHTILFVKNYTDNFQKEEIKDGVIMDYLSPQSKLRTINNQNFMKKHFDRDKLLLQKSIYLGIKEKIIIENLSNTVDEIFHYAIERAISFLGKPPCRFSFIGFGSIGRKEVSFNSDQDTAIIFESSNENNYDNNDNENSKDREYFIKLGERVTNICKDMGIPVCEGGNSASNANLCLSRSRWKEMFSEIIYNSEPENIIKLNVLFDFRTIYGDFYFENDLREHIFNEIKNKPSFLYNLARDIISFKTPSDIFGRIVSESNTEKYIDIKGMVLHFVNFARTCSLKFGIEKTNTLERLIELSNNNHIPQDFGNELIEAWNYLSSLRLKNQVKAIEINFPNENYLILDKLTKWEESKIKNASSLINKMQNRLSQE